MNETSCKECHQDIPVSLDYRSMTIATKSKTPASLCKADTRLRAVIRKYVRITLAIVIGLIVVALGTFGVVWFGRLVCIDHSSPNWFLYWIIGAISGCLAYLCLCVSYKIGDSIINAWSKKPIE